MQQPVVGRFAPTPSGRMHLGNVFSALLCWLSAKSQGGQVLLRIEDLDLARTNPAFIGELLSDLAWLGLPFDSCADRKPIEEGCQFHDVLAKLSSKSNYFISFEMIFDDSCPISLPALCFQSRRSAYYEACLSLLRDKDLLYPCFCSRAELHTAEAPHLTDGSYLYDRRCRDLTQAQIAQKLSQRGAATRVAVPDMVVAFTDGCQGYYAENLAQDCGDFILQRSDGVFAYQLAAPADDGAMGVTEVVRGRDLLSSAPRQIWLMETLGFVAPKFCHVPLLLAPDGRRLSKREKDLDLGAIRAKCKGPEKLLGVLAHLAGLLEAPVPVAAAELVPGFSWEKIQRKDIVLPSSFADAVC